MARMLIEDAEFAKQEVFRSGMHASAQCSSSSANNLSQESRDLHERVENVLSTQGDTFLTLRKSLEDTLSAQESLSRTFRDRLEEVLLTQENTSLSLRRGLEESLSKQDRTYSMAQRK